MTATFDPKKDAENLKKHGVSLTEGDGVLSDPLASRSKMNRLTESNGS
jgi:uncharacterized DUF497 family protein